MQDKFSIIVQGPANSISLAGLKRYSQFGEVIVSCWVNDEIGTDLLNVTVVKSPIPIGLFANPQNIFMQCTTVEAGLRMCRTPYFIKVRSDEYYSDLTPIMEKVFTAPNKYTCNNIWFKKIAKEWLHPGDHLFAGSVDRFTTTLRDVMDICRRVGPVNNVLSCNQYGFRENIWPYLSVETVIFLSFLKTFYGNNLEILLSNLHSSNRLKELMEAHTDFVPIDMLGEYIWSFVNLQGKREFLTNSQIMYDWPDSPSIRTFSEI